MSCLVSRFQKLLLLASLAATVSSTLAATVSPEWEVLKKLTPRHYVCLRAARPPAIDGLLDDPAWKAAQWSEEFKNIQGDSKPVPKYRTRMKMAWDNKYLYIAAEIEEPHVMATLTQHDSVIFQDNDFEVFIDPDGDQQNYLEMEINALNTVWDLILDKPYIEGGPARNEFEIKGLKTAVHVRGSLNNSRDQDLGWTVEIAIPWTGLSPAVRKSVKPPQSGETWRVNFSRVEWQFTVDATSGKYVKVPNRPEDNWIWSPQGLVDMHRPNNWGFLQFSKRSSGKPRFVPPSSFPLQRELVGLYYSQREFRKAKGHWAESLSELDAPADTKQSDFRLVKNGPGWIIEANHENRTWKIQQDGRLWSEPLKGN